jgi:hypothetical protein
VRCADPHAPEADAAAAVGTLSRTVMWPGIKNDDPSRPAHFGYFYGPIGVSAAAFLISLCVDLRHPGTHVHWTQRSGAIVALCGVVSGFGAATRMWHIRGGRIYGVYSEIPYGPVGLILGALGTVIWAYGDLCL